MSPPPFTPEEFERQMKELKEKCSYDTEHLHVLMDNALCEMLEDLGYREGVAVFQKTNKWYS